MNKQSNLIELSEQEIRNTELNILKYLTDFCEKQNICYVLAFGTLLGAVRHRGFIPWDLDIDITMLRSDYERFMDSWTDTEDFALVSIETDPKSALSFAKIVDLHTVCFENGIKRPKGGLWVDIFPLDAVPEEKDLIVSHYNKVVDLHDSFMHLAFIHRHNSFLGRFFRRIKYSFIYSDVSYLWESVFTRYERLLQESIKYNSDDTENVTSNMIIIDRPEKRKYGFPKTTHTDYIYAPFENYSFRIPKDYDSLLQSFYGNYMELPPENERVDHHKLKAYKIK